MSLAPRSLLHLRHELRQAVGAGDVAVDAEALYRGGEFYNRLPEQVSSCYPQYMSDLFEKIKRVPAGWRRRLYFVGVLTEAMIPAGIRPVIVGGNAVEFYTIGGYATGDIDIVIPDRREIDRLLSSMGFAREGRHWYSEELDLAIEIPGSVLAGDMERVTEVEIEGRTVYIIGIEDLIIDRLNAFVYWSSERDGELAKEMLVLHLPQIDHPYLERRASDEGVAAALQDMMESTRK